MSGDQGRSPRGRRSSPGLEGWQESGQGHSIPELALNLGVVRSLRENFSCHEILLLARDYWPSIIQCIALDPGLLAKLTGLDNLGLRAQETLVSGLFGIM